MGAPAPDSPALTAWDLPLFPAVQASTEFHEWLWMYDPAAATPQQKEAWRRADKYSLAEISVLTDQESFYGRRRAFRIAEIARSLRRVFRAASGFSAVELAYVLTHSTNASAIAADVLAEAQWHASGGGLSPFNGCRILHSLAWAIESLAGEDAVSLAHLLPGLGQALSPAQREWLAGRGMGIDDATGAQVWCRQVKAEAFAAQGRAILFSVSRPAPLAVSPLRSDEIVWGRAPARLDLGGGWSDTPPYTLERGGAVINAAICLNGQPPIHAYARLTRDPVIRIASIDVGTRVELTSLDELLNYNNARDEFALVKAALAMSGLSPAAASWPEGTTLQHMLETLGGGIELTTLAAIPKGSGLGTSSIVGAVVLAVVQRVLGKSLTPQELFHGVLRLEQALTTGGGWQDQIGGAVDGVKVITTAPGLVPDPRIHYVPADVLDPEANGGCTLVYYTGLTRLAKNILQQVVGRYLDRDREAMNTLAQIHALPPLTAQAMARKDLAGFGKLIDRAWRLNKQLDPASSNETVEAILAGLGPHIHGAKLLGAGGGGFLLIVCKSPADAANVRHLLETQPPNPRARFFEFNIDLQGLVVTTC
ncbi:MAG: hypothetical protein NT031_19975 [Planctomycetota bacterium]|nr:hypothetical protein [Planctomycetota bacterium]